MQIYLTALKDFDAIPEGHVVKGKRFVVDSVARAEMFIATGRAQREKLNAIPGTIVPASETKIIQPGVDFETPEVKAEIKDETPEKPIEELPEERKPTMKRRAR